MNFRTAILIALAVCVAALAVYLALPTQPPSQPQRPAEHVATTVAQGAAASDATASSAAKSPATPGPRRDALLSRIENMLERLQKGPLTPAELDQLRRELLAANPQAAITAIRDFLGSGRDAKTGQEFAPGAGQQLEESPTLRVFLLDVLGAISRKTGGGEAAAVARTILETKTSADEWAISLRNVAWHEPQAAPYLAGKMRELLSHQPWREQPSAGMLEAFDVIVFAKDATFIPTLAELAGGEQEMLQRAAAVALDRLSEAAPLEVMNYLNANPAAVADRPFARADYFAKADLSKAPERQAVEVYLSRQDVAAEEKAKLLKALATPGSFISDNLLTGSPVPSPEEDAARLQVLQKTTGEWLAAGRFPEIRPAIQQLHGRLSR